MKTILITGSDGQLGSEFKNIANTCHDIFFVFCDREQFDISSRKDIMYYLMEGNIDVVINCAAYTGVLGSDTERGKSLSANALGPMRLAKLCNRLNIDFFHFSCAHVFDGDTQKPYDEISRTRPKSFFGHTKVLGERLVRKYNPNAYILRTSWLYSTYGDNFFNKVLDAAALKKEINALGDQIGTPTSAMTLAKTVMEMIQIIDDPEKRSPGVYHYTCDGFTNWYGFAAEVLNELNSPCKINLIETDSYPTETMTPKYCVMKSRKIKNTFKVATPHWRDSLKDCLSNISDKKKVA